MTNTVTPVDVNQAFAEERATQLRAATDAQARFDARVAAGRLTNLGNGRYRVTDPGSWDNGEILVQRAGQILPEHGLDTTLGQAALYSTVPGWHLLGNVVPGGTTDIDTVLHFGGIAFEVARRPVLFRNELDGPALVLPDQFVTVRQDTQAGLGVVGARYEVMQNRAVFEFLQDLVDIYDVTWESAGALRGGRKVFVSLKLPNTIVIDVAGINDQILPFIAAINSHDGSSPFQVVVTPWRPLCGNTERFAVRDAYTRWGVRHTRNASAGVDEARRTLGLAVTFFDQFAAEEEALAQTAITIDDFRSAVGDLWEPPADDATARTKTNHRNRMTALTNGFTTNAAALGFTAYAAERAITEHTDWVRTVRPPQSLRDSERAFRATLALEGAEDDLKSRAHQRLLTLTTR